MKKESGRTRRSAGEKCVEVFSDDKRKDQRIPFGTVVVNGEAGNDLAWHWQ